jgi:cellulose synthase (UDP-forming)
LIVLTVFGLIINTIPEWRIVDSVQMLPVVAFWSAFNVIVLFLVCMMSLQAPRRRGEERFDLDEKIRIIDPSGTVSSGRIKDISLSGVHIEEDSNSTAATDNHTPVARVGDSIRIFITEVGFVSGTVARQMGRFLGIQFVLPPSVERDLLIRKMFTAGLDTTHVDASAWSATGAMLKSIWGMRTEMLERKIEDTSDIVAAAPVEKLPARSLLISPQPRASQSYLHLTQVQL